MGPWFPVFKGPIRGLGGTERYYISYSRATWPSNPSLAGPISTANELREA